MKTSIVAAIALTSAALVAQPAQAHGRSDAGVFIAGAIAAVAIGAALAQPNVTYAAPAPVYSPPVYAPPVASYPAPVYGPPVGYRQSAYYPAPTVVYAPPVRYESHRYGYRGDYDRDRGHGYGHDNGRHVGWDRR